MFSFARLLLRQDIARWRDDSRIVAINTLHQLAADLVARFQRDDLSNLSYRELAFSRHGYLTHHVEPVIAMAAKGVIEALVEDANRSLQSIAERNVIWFDRPVHSETADSALEGLGQVAGAAAPLASGIALSTALPAMATTTTVAWFGLVTTTAISWPVVAIGSAVAGTAIAMGAHNALGLRDKFEQGLRTRVTDYVTARLIAGSHGKPSLLEHVEAMIDTAAEAARKG